MKTVKLLALILTISLAMSLCSSAAFAAGKEVIEAKVTLRFVEGDSRFVGDGDTDGNTILSAGPDSTTGSGGGGGSGSGSGSGGSGSNIRRDADSAAGAAASDASASVAIGDRVVPLSDTVSVPDTDVPLSDAEFFGNLPKTGGDTLIPILLVILGAALMMYAVSVKHPETA